VELKDAVVSSCLAFAADPPDRMAGREGVVAVFEGAAVLSPARAMFSEGYISKSDYRRHGRPLYLVAVRCGSSERVEADELASQLARLSYVEGYEKYVAELAATVMTVEVTHEAPGRYVVYREAEAVAEASATMHAYLSLDQLPHEWMVSRRARLLRALEGRGNVKVAVLLGYGSRRHPRSRLAVYIVVKAEVRQLREEVSVPEAEVAAERVEAGPAQPPTLRGLDLLDLDVRVETLVD